LGADRSKLETAVSDLSTKLDRETRYADEVTMVSKSIRELDARIDDVSKRAVDADLIQGILNQLIARLDAIVSAQVDVRPIEIAIGALNEKMDLAERSQSELRLVEQAADLLNARLGVANTTAVHNADIVSAGGELLQHVQALRLDLQSATSARSPASDFLREIAELRADQRNSDRRTSERLSEVRNALENLIDHFQELESYSARAEEGISQSKDASTHFTAPLALGQMSNPGGGNDAKLRDIPDRAPSRSPLGPNSLSALAQSIDASDVLLEPGTSAPKAIRSGNVESPDPTARSGINSHIAAARRAAQAVIAESGSRNVQRDLPLSPSRSNSPSSNLAGAKSRSFFRGRRRPVLLAIALFATATTAALIAWRGDLTQAFRHQQVSAPVRSDNPQPSVQEGDRSAKRLGTIDYSPVGNVAPTGIKTSEHPSAAPAPTDLVAALPPGFPQSLRDEAAGGNPAAETELALRYLDGRTLAKDPAIAARWLELAAVQGLPVAQYRLATLYEKGNGVARDTSLARAWYLKAANAGNVRAMHNLAVLTAEDPRDGKPDYAEAAHWFHRAGEMGVRDSQFNLGVLYGRGLGVPQDLSQSWLWFSLAARQGDDDAAAKRDEVAARMDPNAQTAASKALGEFRTRTPDPEANEAPSFPGGSRGRTNEPPAAPVAPPAERGSSAPSVSG
jgi:localization factor PodJL